MSGPPAPGTSAGVKRPRATAWKGRPTGRGASGSAFPRRAWERGVAASNIPNHRSPPMRTACCLILTCVLVCVAFHPVFAADNTPPEGFSAAFNGKDLTGWKGLLKGPNDNPAKRAKLTPERTGQGPGRGRRRHAGTLESRGRGAGVRRQGPQPLHGQGLRRLRDVGRLEDPAQGRQRHLSPRHAAGADLGQPRSARAACTTTRRTPASRRRTPTSPSASGTRSTSRWSATR